MPDVALAAFGLTCLLLISDGLRTRTGVYQFSFLAGCGLFGFLFPQALGIVASPGMAPEGGVVKALVMSTLCAAAIYMGWKAPVRARGAVQSRPPFPLKPMYWCGLASIIVGLIGFVKLAGLSGGVLGHYSTHGSYTLEWQGLPVAYEFFVLYFYLGMVLVALIALRLRSWLLLIPATVPGLVVLADIVFLGRRSSFIWLGAALGCSLYFSRKLAPPRSLVLALAPLAMAAMFIAPAYRGNSEIGGSTSKIKQISISKILHGVVSGTRGEFWTTSYLTEIADTQGLFQGGAGFYNAFVTMYVPKLIVGSKFKAKLFADMPTARVAPNNFGWVMPYGMVPTGPYSVFEQFWYLGALCFYFLARWLKRHWIRAVAGDMWSQVVYSVTVAFAVAAVVSDFYAIYTPVFMFILPLTILMRLRGVLRRTARPYVTAITLRSRPSMQSQEPHSNCIS